MRQMRKRIKREFRVVIYKGLGARAGPGGWCFYEYGYNNYEKMAVRWHLRNVVERLIIAYASASSSEEPAS